ncbi:MAG: ABC transporter ATP-binding protein [Actinomycetota bacterium]
MRQRLRGEGDLGWRWALRDIDFSMDPGDSIGLVGPNGSGKTTLLKILARVMYPYAGRVEVQGMVGALIAVSAGLHPELSGRENVYITGSLLGLPRKEVARRFDEIVAFAELEDAINRQVKFFSSGMSMRLGFAIAAFMEPDIMLVDEVLAVGDASFQQKCLDRIRSLLAGGTTLIFVSHELASVEATCEKAIWLRDGTIAEMGPAREVLGAYRRSVEERAETTFRASGVVRVVKTEVSGPEGGMPISNGRLEVRAVIESPDDRSGRLILGVSEGPATPIFILRRDVSLKAGETEVRASIPSLPLPQGRFALWVAVLDKRGRDLLPWHPVAHFDIGGPRLEPVPPGIMRLAPVQVESTWEVEPLG